MEKETESPGLTHRALARHLFFPVLLCGVLLFAIPPFVVMAEELGLVMPASTVLVLEASLLLRRHWALAPLVVAMLLSTDFGMYFLLRRRLGNGAARLWAGIVTVCQIACAVLLVVALLLPLMSISSAIDGNK